MAERKEKIRERKEKIRILSFGFDVKSWHPGYEVPQADLTLDCRHIFDPARIELFGSQHSGLEQDVRDFVLEFHESEELLEEAIDYVEACGNVSETVTIAFGCMWGKHRSVSLAIVLSERLKEMGYYVEVKHISIEGGWIKV